MKITKIGWVGKTADFPKIAIDDYYGICSIKEVHTKGKSQHWMKEDWPPRKVLVAIFDPDKYEIREK